MSKVSQRKERVKAATMAETKVQRQGTKDTGQRAEERDGSPKGNSSGAWRQDTRISIAHKAFNA